MEIRTFTKSERLCGEIVVNELFTQGVSFLQYPVRVVWKATPSEQPGMQVLFSVPRKKIKRAVGRNRVKRLLREAWRLNKGTLDEAVRLQGINLQVALVWLPLDPLPFAKVEQKTKDLMDKMLRLIANPS